MEAEGLEDATRVVYESFREIDEIILKIEEKGVQLYWKMKDVYIVEFYIELYKDTLKDLLDIYSDVWIKLGYPTEELLASRYNERCKYMKEGFVLINILL